MRKRRLWIFGLCAIVVVMVSAGCASTEVVELDNRSSLMYSSSELDSGDFYNSSYSSFFTVEGMEPAFSGFDEDIFKMMKSAIADGSATKELLSDKNNEALKQDLSESLKKKVKKGEAVLFSVPENSKNEGFIDTFVHYYIYDKEAERFALYSFVLGIFEDGYKEYKELEELSSNIWSAINMCEENIQLCNETIQRCSNPTIQKSRVVEVPYTVTEQIWHPGSGGRRTNSSFGSSEATPSYTETRTYTAYRNELEYYTVPDPNYDPAAVAEAKEWLQYWTSEKESAEQAWRNTINWRNEMPLPFTVEPMVVNINAMMEDSQL